jgi:hypothetical protein
VLREVDRLASSEPVSVREVAVPAEVFASLTVRRLPIEIVAFLLGTIYDIGVPGADGPLVPAPRTALPVRRLHPDPGGLASLRVE